MTDELADRVARLERRLDGAESVLALHDLKARYGELVDARFVRGAAVAPEPLGDLARRAAALFTEDGVWDGGPGLGVARGREEIAARLAAPPWCSPGTCSSSRASRWTVTGPRAGGTCSARAPGPTGRHCGWPATRTTSTPGWTASGCTAP